jgi:hypothetical protein
MPRRLLVLLILFVGFILLSMAAFITLPWIMLSLKPPIGTILVYEMEGLHPTQDPSEVAKKRLLRLIGD